MVGIFKNRHYLIVLMELIKKIIFMNSQIYIPQA